MKKQLAVEVQYGIVTYAGRSGQNSLSKIESILVDWECPKIFHEIEDTLASYVFMPEAGSDLTTILIKISVNDLVTAFQMPMSSVLCKNLFRIFLVRRYTADAINDLLTGLAGFFIDGFSLNHEGLAHIGKVEVVIQFYLDPDLPRLNPAMLPITYLVEISHVWVALKKEGDSLEQCGLVPYLP